MRRNKILNVNNSNVYWNRRVKVILLGSCRILKEAGPITEVLKVRKDWSTVFLHLASLISNISRLLSKIATGQTLYSSLQLGKHKHIAKHTHIKRSHKFEVFWSKNVKCWVVILLFVCFFNLVTITVPCALKLEVMLLNLPLGIMTPHQSGSFRKE